MFVMTQDGRTALNSCAIACYRISADPYQALTEGPQQWQLTAGVGEKYVTLALYKSETDAKHDLDTMLQLLAAESIGTGGQFVYQAGTSATAEVSEPVTGSAITVESPVVPADADIPDSIFEDVLGQCGDIGRARSMSLEDADFPVSLYFRLKHAGIGSIKQMLFAYKTYGAGLGFKMTSPCAEQEIVKFVSELANSPAVFNPNRSAYADQSN